MIKVGIVGCGLIGDVHLRVLNSMKNISVVGIADRDIERAKSFASRAKVGVFAGDLETLLERAKPDAVHILTPPFTHASLACTALQAGSHVYVEKPMALTSEEAQSMVAAAAERKRLLTVGHNNLFSPVVREAYRRVKDGDIGKLIGINVFHGSLPIHTPWIYRLPSGPWFNDVDHLLYLSRLFMGDADVVRAVSFSATDKSRVDGLHLALRHPVGWSSLTYSTLAAPFQIRITLFGDKQTVELDLISEIMVALRNLDMHRWLRKGKMSLDVASQVLLRTGWQANRFFAGYERGHSGHRFLIEAFYKAIKEGLPSPVPLDHCLRIVEIKGKIQDLLKGSE
jgi:2-alkyl-3-oxoalkanoate reductase